MEKGQAALLCDNMKPEAQNNNSSSEPLVPMWKKIREERFNPSDHSPISEAPACPQTWGPLSVTHAFRWINLR